MSLKFNFNHLTLLSALFISSVAIWYSVAGLAAIFAASKVPVIIMGTALEVGKLVVAVWLHRNWHDAKTWIKTYLSIAIIILMLLTSMGIFGYLSKSHIEQTSQSAEQKALVERTDSEIARYKAIIARSTEKIENYENNGGGLGAAINSQIDKEQKRIDSAYERIKPVIQTQLNIIEKEKSNIKSRIYPYSVEISIIDSELQSLQDALVRKDYRTAQGIAGTKVDGRYGSRTQKAVKDYRTSKQQRRKELLAKINTIENSPNMIIELAHTEIRRINESIKQEISESNRTISELRKNLQNANDASELETLISTEQGRIKNANSELDKLIQNKFQLEASQRKLVAEVGPIKYIAEFIYGENTNESILEKAVRWVIMLIIFVFDPLAILLLIAAQYSFEKSEEKILSISKPIVKDKKEEKIIPIEEKYENHNKNHEEPIKKIINMTRVGENYISFNGKNYRIRALMQAFPELNLNLQNEVEFGSKFPNNAKFGTMFLLTSIPTQLYIFNGESWDRIDKNILEEGAYSNEYLSYLAEQILKNKYNRDLLNEKERQRLNSLL